MNDQVALVEAAQDALELVGELTECARHSTGRCDEHIRIQRPKVRKESRYDPTVRRPTWTWRGWTASRSPE